MKYIKHILLWLMILSVFLCAGCASSENPYSKEGAVNSLPRYQELSALIGLSKAEVLSKLVLGAEDLTEISLEQYSTPLEVEYCGVKFSIVLGFNIHDGVLSSIKYQAAYIGVPETAAKDTFAVANALAGTMGMDSAMGETAILGLTEDDLSKSLSSDKSFTKVVFWNLKNDVKNQQSTYMEQTKNANYWKETYGNLQPQYYLEMQISHLTEENTVYLVIDYSISPERSVDVD